MGEKGKKKNRVRLRGWLDVAQRKLKAKWQEILICEGRDSRGETLRHRTASWLTVITGLFFSRHNRLLLSNTIMPTFNHTPLFSCTIFIN